MTVRRYGRLGIAEKRRSWMGQRSLFARFGRHDDESVRNAFARRIRDDQTLAIRTPGEKAGDFRGAEHADLDVREFSLGPTERRDEPQTSLVL
jgi:hypothetical protein